MIEADEKREAEEEQRNTHACSASRSAALDLAGVPAKIEHRGQKEGTANRGVGGWSFSRLNYADCRCLSIGHARARAGIPRGAGGDSNCEDSMCGLSSDSSIPSRKGLALGR